jgi:UDP-glucose 4-epimerase
MARRVIVTGGAGYIGSHICVELLADGREVLVIDDFSNSSPKALDRIAEIAGRRPQFVEADLADPAGAQLAAEAIADFRPDGAIHLAGLKAVGESVADPVRYYAVNLGSALALVRSLERVNARAIVFSSSATVYGDLNQSPVSETGATGPTNPYGKSKFFIEEMLKDLATADARWRIVNLRYFNPVGAHPSGRIGEDPAGVPNNLFPFIAQIAVGRLQKLKVFGGDYPTRDGTGVRDYIPAQAPPTSISGPARACRFWRRFQRSSASRTATFHLKSSRGDPATSPRSTPTQPRRRRFWAGAR